MEYPKEKARAVAGRGSFFIEAAALARHRIEVRQVARRA
jgi:hypothetical protein